MVTVDTYNPLSSLLLFDEFVNVGGVVIILLLANIVLANNFLVSKLVNKTRQKINIFYIHFLSTIINRNFKMIINFV